MAVAHGKHGGERERNTWKTLAFLGRYGHQPIEEMKRMTSRELHLLARAIGELLEEESPEQTAAANA